MAIFSAKAIVSAREPKVALGGRRTTPAIGGRAIGGRTAAILPILAPILAPGRDAVPAELGDGPVVGGGAAGGGSGIGCAVLGLTVTCAALRVPSLSAVTLTVPADFAVVSPED